MESTKDFPSVKKFNGKNFQIWKYQLESNFCGLDFLEILKGVEILNNLKNAIAWKCEDMQAQNILTQNINDKVLISLLSYKTYI